MKINILIMASTLLILLTECSKTEKSVIVAPTDNNVTLKAYVHNPATKVGFASDGAFYWSSSDRLGVLDNREIPVFHEFTLNAASIGQTNGTFTGTLGSETVQFGEYAVYPYNMGHSVSGTTLTYNFPTSYTYDKVNADYFTTDDKKGTGNSFNAPMWGKIETGSVQMKHLGGVFCIKIANMPCEAGTLTLMSDKKISGTYTVDLSATEPQIASTAAIDDAEKIVSIAFSNTTVGGSSVFYIPVPVGEHDLSIKMVNNESAELFDTHIGKYTVLRCDLRSIFIVTLEGYAFEMKFVKSGTFMMGTSDNDSDAYNNEKPAHEVTLTKDYWMGKYEVTQGLWMAVMSKNNPTYTNPSCFTSVNGYTNDLQRPVEQVSWDDIVNDFLPKLNLMTGMTFKLPTEAQWEFAARGGNKHNDPYYKYSGSNDIDAVAWYYGSHQTHPVGQKKSNELGIYDMSGNVCEWCHDWYDEDGNNYYQKCFNQGTVEDPTGPKSGSCRIIRGGSWNVYMSNCCVSFRGNHSPDYRNNYSGFRLVLVLP